MIVIIGEKPSVAREIAAVVGANNKKEGYIEGNGYVVTWAYGHLIGLEQPEAYGYKGNWCREQLPMLPETFSIAPIVSTDKNIQKLHKTQLKVIENLFKKANNIIVATDAGREGELIFRYIYNYLHISTPFKRLWISSLTEKSIKEGLANLKPGNEYNRLYEAGKARSEADWLVGMNGTRATTINVNDRSVWSVGRVQTPTLCMICQRYLENKNFKSTPYWELKTEFTKSGLRFFGTNSHRFEDKNKAEEIKKRIEDEGFMKILSVEKKPSYSNPPLLYDLTTIQKDANSKYGFSADTTLKICQTLYEKKLTTYPRTGSRYIPEDIYETLPLLVKNASLYPRFKEHASSLVGKTLGKSSVNSGKVTDHHALLPTEIIPDINSMKEEERKIYEMIVGRMLESVSEREEKFVTTVVMTSENCKDFPMIAKGSIIRKQGWKAVFNEKIMVAEEENTALPEMAKDEKLPVEAVILMDKKTKAPPLLTENTLLGMMETAGKDLEDGEQREAMKDIGIGTPATRAETIEKIIRTKYVVREKKNLVPTEKGLNLYHTVKDMMIGNVEMTGKWENALNKIEKGLLDVNLFNEEIRKYTQVITKELLDSKIEKTRESLVKSIPQMICPKCGKPFIVSDKICKCSDGEGCRFFFWRTVCQRKLTEKDIKDILAYGKTIGKVKLKKKDGKTFEAQLILTEDGKFTFGR